MSEKLTGQQSPFDVRIFASGKVRWRCTHPDHPIAVSGSGRAREALEDFSAHARTHHPALTEEEV